MKRFITILFCATLFSSGSSQITENPISIFDRIRNVPSPTAASLGQYVDIPVSLYGGTARNLYSYLRNRFGKL